MDSAGGSCGLHPDHSYICTQTQAEGLAGQRCLSYAGSHRFLITSTGHGQAHNSSDLALRGPNKEKKKKENYSSPVFSGSVLVPSCLLTTDLKKKGKLYLKGGRVTEETVCILLLFSFHM